MRRTTRGFSMVEVMVSMAILAMIALAIYGLLEAGTNSYNSTARKDTLQAAARNALDRLAEEIRTANPASTAFTYAPQVTPLQPVTNNTCNIVLSRALAYTAADIDPVEGTVNVEGSTTYGTAIGYFVEVSPADANGNGKADEGRLVRTHIEGGKLIKSIICDHVEAGGFTAVFTDNVLKITLNLAVADGKYSGGKPRMIKTTASTTLLLRNKKI